MRLRIPAPFDPHVHLRDLDWAHKGSFASETAAALAGGYCALLDMPNTPPATINPDALAHKQARFRDTARCDWGLWFGAAQPGNQTCFSTVQHEVCGLKIYNNETTGNLLIEDQALRDSLFAAWPTGKPIAVHAEEQTVADILELVRRHSRHVHFCHISSAAELRLLAAAKEEGLPVSIGVCPHHLFLTRDDLAALGPLGLMKPELKAAADRDALRQAIASGLVDVANLTMRLTRSRRSRAHSRPTVCRAWRPRCPCSARRCTKAGWSPRAWSSWSPIIHAASLATLPRQTAGPNWTSVPRR